MILPARSPLAIGSCDNAGLFSEAAAANALPLTRSRRKRMQKLLMDYLQKILTAPRL